MAVTFIVHTVYGEKCRGLAWRGSTEEDAFIMGFTQNSVVIAFVPPSFVCVCWVGLKWEMPEDDKVKATQNTLTRPG